MDSTFRSLNTKMIYLQEVRCHRPLGLKKQHELTEHKLGASGLLHPKSPTARRNTERTKLETRCGEAHRACTRTSTPTRTLLSAAPGAPPGTTSGGRSRHTPAASLRTDTSLACFSRALAPASSTPPSFLPSPRPPPPTSHFNSGVAGPLRRPPPGALADAEAFTGRRRSRRGVRSDGAAAGAGAAVAERFLELICGGYGSGRPAPAAASEWSTPAGRQRARRGGARRTRRRSTGTAWKRSRVDRRETLEPWRWWGASGNGSSKWGK